MALSSKQIAEQYLVLTAIGRDKTGLVSELTGLVSECRCNVVDSKMAIFGKEFFRVSRQSCFPTHLLRPVYLMR